MIQIDWRNSTKTTWEHEIIIKQAWRARIFTISGCIITVFSALGFIFAPVIGLSTRTTNNITDLYEGFNLIFQSYYPFNYGRRPIFECVYATQLIAAICASFPVSVPDNFFVAMVLHACGQCEILKKRTKYFLDDDDIAKVDYKTFKTKLIKIVYSHVRLIR